MTSSRPIGIEDQISAEENIRTSFFTDDVQDDSDTDQHLFSESQIPDPQSTVRAIKPDKARMVFCREFYAYRFQIRAKSNSILLQSGRFLQQFSVDMYVKIETSRLDYFRNRQEEIRADLYLGIVDSVSHGESNGSKVGIRIVLPGTFTGGPRDMRKRYLVAMTLVQRYGKPDLFLTMTCNPNWPEIKAELKQHEQAQNRPDLATRIFHAKFEYLRREVVKKELFGPIAAYTFAIEFQKRGLPHVHMLIILKKAYKLNTAEQINALISAEIPNKNHQPHLYAMVVKHMLHGPCGELNMPKMPVWKKESAATITQKTTVQKQLSVQMVIPYTKGRPMVEKKQYVAIN
ncbi:hypothetical protein RHGRI_033626 [Rhododendron griersonianum]|uniref:Helitron helicase-like domain-containing protein n=1 Tax=Rhododendron griersonianum TaxID=479676 RepID=A0AAV6I0U4_9ERIC|nr:hypothetical protein RHGRI_033626 [Rhododendron griersonianum]